MVPPADVVSWILVLATVLHDLVLRVPSPTKSTWSPFRNFLTLEDLEELPGPLARRSRLKAASLVGLGLIQCAGWLACFVYALISRELPALVPFFNSLAWVRSTMLHALHLAD